MIRASIEQLSQVTTIQIWEGGGPGTRMARICKRFFHAKCDPRSRSMPNRRYSGWGLICESRFSAIVVFLFFLQAIVWTNTRPERKITRPGQNWVRIENRNRLSDQGYPSLEVRTRTDTYEWSSRFAEFPKSGYRWLFSLRWIPKVTVDHVGWDPHSILPGASECPGITSSHHVQSSSQRLGDFWTYLVPDQIQPGRILARDLHGYRHSTAVPPYFSECIDVGGLAEAAMRIARTAHQRLLLIIVSS